MTDRLRREEIPPGGRHSIRLPAELQTAVERALQALPAAQWTREAQALSERYRGPRGEDAAPLATGQAQVLGYLAMIFPASYAQLRGAMAATAARIPEWAPASMLDIGSGPGTALWAATEQWPSLRKLQAWERERAFVTLGRTLQQAGGSAALRGAEWERIDLAQLERARRQQYDLVVLGHVLNELPAELRPRIVDSAWQMTAGLLLIVEPGTSAAFAVVRAARDRLLQQGAHTVAPCPHDRPCPLVGDWCHFPQRVARPEFQRRARGAPSQWEDSKFSYAAMARFAPAVQIWGRVIDEPETTKAYAEVLASTRRGTGRFRALKRHRETFRAVKELRWGEALAQPLPEPIHPIDPLIWDDEEDGSS